MGRYKDSILQDNISEGLFVVTGMFYRWTVGAKLLLEQLCLDKINYERY
jgi:hypothetical protein